MSRCENKFKLKFTNQKTLFCSFLALFSAPGFPFTNLPNISFWHTDSLMVIYFLRKSQNKAIDGSSHIFSRCYFQMCKFLFELSLRLIDTDNTENTESPFVAIILIVSFISLDCCFKYTTLWILKHTQIYFQNMLPIRKYIKQNIVLQTNS